MDEARLLNPGAPTPDDRKATVQAFSIEWNTPTVHDTTASLRVFAVMALCVALTNIDGGAIPAMLPKLSKGCLFRISVPPLTANETDVFLDALVGTTMRDRLNWFLKKEVDLAQWGKGAMLTNPRARNPEVVETVLLTTDRLVFNHTNSSLQNYPPFTSVFSERSISQAPYPSECEPTGDFIYEIPYFANDTLIVDMDILTCLAANNQCALDGRFLSFLRGCLRWRPRVSFVSGAFPKWNFQFYMDDTSDRSPVPFSVALRSTTLTTDAWDYSIPICTVDIPERRATLVPLIHVNRSLLAAQPVLLRADADYVYGDEQVYPCLDDNDVGILGAMPFVGICVSCVIITLSRYKGLSNKVYIMGACVLSVHALIAFMLTTGTQYMWTARFLSGMFQCPIITIAPVWVAHFGKTRQTQWMAVLQGISCMGSLLGYVIMSTLVVHDVHYAWAFALQACILAVCVALVATIPAHRLNTSQVPSPTVTQLGWLFWHVCLILCWVIFGITGIQLWTTKYFLVAFLQPFSTVTSHFVALCLASVALGLFIGSRTQFCFRTLDGILSTLRYVATCFVAAVAANIALLGCAPAYAALDLGCDAHHIEVARSCSISDAVDCEFSMHCAQLAQGSGYYCALMALSCVLCSGAALFPVCASLQLNVVDEMVRPTAVTVNLFVTHLLGYAFGAWLPGFAGEYFDGAAWQRVRVAMAVACLLPSIGFLNIYAAYVLVRKKKRKEMHAPWCTNSSISPS